MSLPKRILQTIEATPDDRELANALARYAAEEGAAFSQAASSWAPVLYHRNRVAFLPLIEQHVDAWSLQGTKDLDSWMSEAIANRDSRLYRQLIQAWLRDNFGWAKAAREWSNLLLKAFREAPDRAARRDVVDRLDVWHELPDEAAVEMYRVDPVVTGEFVVRRLERERWYEVVYTRFAEAAREAGDDELYFELYRRTFPPDVWRKDAARLCEAVADPAQLIRELDNRDLSHPEGGLGADDFTMLLEKRGRDVAPYLRRAVSRTETWSPNDNPWRKFIERSLDNDWLDLFGVVARRHLAPTTYNELLQRFVTDRATSEHQTVARIMQLVGARHGWGEFRSLVPLESEVAIALYQRFPELLTGPFAPHLIVTMKNDLTSLASVADLRGDTKLVDILTAAAISLQQVYYRPDVPKDDWWYMQHFRSMSAANFAERALGILTRLQPFAVSSRTFTRTKNPLYTLFFRRPEAYLPVRDRVRDLLETSNVDVQTLGLEVLRVRRDAVAEQLAAQSVDHLLALLIDEAPRRTRVAAFDALALAAQSSEVVARVILDHAREATELRRRFYPRDRLVELIGKVTHTWPSLQRPSERQVIYGARQ